MVESKLVELVVAGSNPVDHPIFCLEAQRKQKDAAPKREARRRAGTHCASKPWPGPILLKSNNRRRKPSRSAIPRTPVRPLSTAIAGIVPCSIAR